MSYKWPVVKSRPQDCSPVVFPSILEEKEGKVIGKSERSTLAAKGKQVTCSFRHRKFPDGDYRSGGPFYSARNAPRTPTMNVKLDTTNNFGVRRLYNGPIVQRLNFGDGYIKSPSVTASQEDSHLDRYGSEAISIINPLNPNAQTGIALGELFLDKRISLPGIATWKRRTEVCMAAGEEFLSAQFGWLPLIKDIKDTFQSIRDGHTIMENYHSQDGHEVHREFEFEPIESDNVVQVSAANRCEYSTVASVSSFNGVFAEQSRRDQQKIRRWFSGTFVHYPNKAYDSLLGRRIAEKDGEINKLFGLNLTPELIWNLAPWSWALDWFSNIGSVVSNFTAFELHGLVMKYGFIMEETSGKETLFMPSTGLIKVEGPPPPIWNDYSIKRRKEANPFGFGISWDGLSPLQLAITAALGITRFR